MKKVLIGLVVLAVLIGGGVYYLASNINRYAKDIIETAGTDTVGSAVTVGDVDIDLMGGIATLSDFSVANPEGFSDRDMLHFDELRVAIDIRSLNSEVIHIYSVASTNPSMLYEMRDGMANVDVARERLAGGPPPEEAVEGDPPVLAIDEVAINGISATLLADRLPDPVNVELGNVNLEDLQGTPNEIAQQIARPLITQLSRNAAAALLEAAAREAGDELRERVEEELNEAGGELEERLGDFLNRGN